MQSSFAAQVKDFADRTKENMELVLRESTADVLELMQETQQSKARGAATVVYGKIPVDTGHLVNTIASDLNGSGAFGVDQVGPSFAMTIAGMESGDVAHFAWTAKYAMAINYGHGSYPGAHWVEHGAANWQRIVAANAEKYRP